jgi:hypothetical protein
MKEDKISAIFRFCPRKYVVVTYHRLFLLGQVVSGVENSRRDLANTNRAF